MSVQEEDVGDTLALQLCQKSFDSRPASAKIDEVSSKFRDLPKTQHSTSTNFYMYLFFIFSTSKLSHLRIKVLPV